MDACPRIGPKKAGSGGIQVSVYLKKKPFYSKPKIKIR
jgi:hypothetical protein